LPSNMSEVMRKEKKISFILACAVSLFLFSCTSGEEAVPNKDQFSAKTRLTYVEDEKIMFTYDGVVAADSGKLRYETISGDTSYFIPLVVINRPDINSTYIVVPEKRKYVVYKSEVESGDIPSSMFDEPTGEVERTFVGKEEIGGYATTKYLVKEVYLDGSSSYYTEWLLDGLDYFPVRIEYPIETDDTVSTLIWEVSDIDWGRPPKKMFRVPWWYSEEENLFDIMTEDIR
jgi:hypothetical protein